MFESPLRDAHVDFGCCTWQGLQLVLLIGNQDRCLCREFLLKKACADFGNLFDKQSGREVA